MIVKKKTNCKKRYKTKRSVIIRVVFVYKEAMQKVFDFTNLFKCAILPISKLWENLP